MIKLQATIKTPQNESEAILEQLIALGVTDTTVHNVPFEQFAMESRMNYDCVFRHAWEDKKDVVYIDFFFEDSQEGRDASYFVEFNLKQIPLNLRYIND